MKGFTYLFALILFGTCIFRFLCVPLPTSFTHNPIRTRGDMISTIITGAGLSAYVKKGSSTSLIISSGVALLLLISASLMGNPSSRIGSILALATCIALSGIMGVRAKKSGKLVPAGLVSILSVLMSGGYVATLV